MLAVKTKTYGSAILDAAKGFISSTECYHALLLKMRQASDV